MKATSALVFGSICFSTVVATPGRITRFDANVAKGLRFVRTSEVAGPFWVTEDRKIELLRSAKDVQDLTETYHHSQEQNAQIVMGGIEPTIYPSPSHGSAVKSIISALSIPRMEATLANLTQFNNRYYESNTGASASDWVYNHLSTISKDKSGVTVSQFKHKWSQNSIIAKFNGESTSAPVVIIGCHLDSINLGDPMSGRAPGADDNGTGTSNLIEVFRALIAANFSPVRPVEFHFYSGEEGNLLGSRDVAADYRRRNVPVYAMVNFDMSGYFKPGSTEVIALVTDHVNPGLTAHLRSLVSEYCSIPAGDDACGYECSDHASWTARGYPAANPYEAPTGDDNPYVHTPNDTTSVQGFSWTHSLEFAKLAAAVAVELGSTRDGFWD